MDDHIGKAKQEVGQSTTRRPGEVWGFAQRIVLEISHGGAYSRWTNRLRRQNQGAEVERCRCENRGTVGVKRGIKLVKGVSPSQVGRDLGRSYTPPLEFFSVFLHTNVQCSAYCTRETRITLNRWFVFSSPKHAISLLDILNDNNMAYQFVFAFITVHNDTEVVLFLRKACLPNNEAFV